jgi:hypothetical protein
MVSTDQGTTWDVLMDMSALPPYPGNTGVNAWLTPYHIDLSIYEGETVDLAWRAVDGDGNGLWYSWAIDDCTIGADDHLQSILSSGQPLQSMKKSTRSSRNVVGYDIYRKSYGTTFFSKINTDLVTDTLWFDENLPLGQYLYYVKAQFNECENAANSDTIMVDVVTGMGVGGSSTLSVFPNPVTEYFTVTSSQELSEIRLYEISGRMAGNWVPVDKHKTTIDIRNLKAGLYLLMVCNGLEIRNFKICLIK